MIERHFVLPATIAAAVHGALFFGFPGGAVPPPPKKPPEPVPTIWVTRPAPDDPEPLDVPVETGGGAPVANLRPTFEDLPQRPMAADFTVPVVEGPPIDVRGLTKIVGPAIGTPSGVGERNLRTVLSPTQLDAPPRTRAQASPVYPFEAKRDGRTGRVTVEFVVDEAGRVIEPRVVESTDRIFDEPSLRAVAKWRFEPGTRHGRLVRFRMIVPVLFNLHE